MHKTAAWLFPLIAISVAVFIVVFFIDINLASTKLVTTKTHEDKVLVVKDEETSWIGKLSRIRHPEYLYPVNEVSLEMNSFVSSDENKQYRLSIKLASSY
jgi:protein-S-isoprenylcysteine O-methyltransferase Ste14